MTLKLCIKDVALDIHNEKMGAVEKEGANLTMKEPMKTLVTYSEDGLLQIPTRLYDIIVQEIHPHGPERIFMLSKLAMVTLFALYINTVMKALRMKEGAAFDMIKAAVTTVLSRCWPKTRNIFITQSA